MGLQAEDRGQGTGYRDTVSPYLRATLAYLEAIDALTALAATLDELAAEGMPVATSWAAAMRKNADHIRLAYELAKHVRSLSQAQVIELAEKALEAKLDALRLAHSAQRFIVQLRKTREGAANDAG